MSPSCFNKKLLYDVVPPSSSPPLSSPPSSSLTYSLDSLLDHANASPTLFKIPSSSSPNAVNSPVDSSIALTVLVLLSALFFLGFLSIYIRRFADDDGRSSVRRHPPPPSLRAFSSRHTPMGLDASVIRSLPLVLYDGATKQAIEGCVICLSRFEKGESLKLVPSCQHVFHPACIDTWLASNVSCPLCRSTQFSIKVDEVSRTFTLGREGDVTSGPGDISMECGVTRGNTCHLP